MRIIDNGQGGEVVLSLPEWANGVYITDMPERKSTKLEFDKTVKLSLRAFEIASLRFQK